MIEPTPFWAPGKETIMVNDSELRLLAKLRDIREELTAIDRLLMSYDSASDADRPVRENELVTVIAAERGGIDTRLAAATGMIDQDPELASRCSDSVIRIDNLWAAYCRGWDGRPAGGATAELRTDLRACILEIAFLTVPARVNQDLDTLRVGGRMSFYDEFADELPDRDMATEILVWMSRHPKTVEGVIDLAGGTVVRADPRAWRQFLSAGMVLALGGLMVLIASQSTHWLDWLDLPARAELRGAEFVRGVLVAYGGAVLHIGIAALKQQRSASANGARTFTALGNVLMWVHVNESALLFYTFVVPVTAGVFLVIQGKLVVASVFFIGYAIDSVLDTFVERFEKVAPKQSEVVITAAKG
jgi:hypothetical protein